jgi:predicted transcriptional regulator
VAKELGQQVFLTIYAKLDGHPAGRALLAVISARGEKGADWSDVDLRSGLTAAAALELITTGERDQLLSLGERQVWQGLSGLSELPDETACARAQAFVRAESSLRQKLQQLAASFNSTATAAELLALAGLE